MSVKRHKASESQALVTSRSQTGNSGTVLYDETVVLQGHNGPVFRAQFNHAGSTIASAGADKNINLWHLPVSEAEEAPNFGVLRGHRQAVTSLAWLPDDTIVSASADSTLGLWDTETGQRIRRCQGHESVVNDVAVSVSESLLVSVGDDGVVNLWDQREKSPVNAINTSYPVLSTTFNNRGSTFYVAGIDPVVRAYDTRSLDKELWTSTGHSNTVTSLSINSDDSVLLSRSIDGIVRTYSAKEFVPEGIPRANPYTYEGAPSGLEYQLIQACFSADNISIFSGSEDKTVTTWDFGTRKLTNKLTGHTGTVLGVSYHPTERIVVSTSTDGNVIVREV